MSPRGSFATSFAAPAGGLEPRRSSRGSFSSFAAPAAPPPFGSARRGSGIHGTRRVSGINSTGGSRDPRRSSIAVPEETPLVPLEGTSSAQAPRIPNRRPGRAPPEESPISSSFGRIDWSARQAAAKTAPRRKEVARDGAGETVLHRAARTGNLGQVERFV